ncbi:hypothetical protein PISL3812_02934 [Talaromyces islandicus]|uniref:Uncharacterized protein n=1 Tax=Talaromyces islandicus TaxID=28573 RepID=A0A0U1LTK3_TALIS|nr:hypothetical protein PISL3812_02934 [Talaromyces islandicus]
MATPVKLPLTVRKNIRDEFEPARTMCEEKISSILGEPWKIDFDIPSVWGYANEASPSNSYPRESTGNMLAGYANSAVSGISSFADKFGSDGIAELNKLVSSRSIVLESCLTQVDGTCSCEIANQKLKIIFSPGDIGVNIDDAFSKLSEAVNAASKNSDSVNLPFNTRKDIKENYESRVAGIESRLAQIIGVDKVAIVVDFQAIYAALLAYHGKDNQYSLQGFEDYLGSRTIEYLESLPSALERDGFDKDDMLQEALQEAVSTNTVSVRLVDKLERKMYNETVIQDGKLYLQTVPKNWSVNADQIADGIVDLL